MNATDQAALEERHYAAVQGGVPRKNRTPATTDQATVGVVELPDADPVSPLYQEWRTYRREVTRLLAERLAGKHVLIKKDQVVGILNSHDEAMEAGHQRFFGEPFLVHEIQERERLLRCVTVPRCLS